MGTSDTSIQNKSIQHTSIIGRLNPASFSRIMLYVLAVVFGAMAAIAGGIALQRPTTGLCMLLCVMISYIAASALLVSVIGDVREAAAEPNRQAVRLVADRVQPMRTAGNTRNG